MNNTQNKNSLLEALPNRHMSALNRWNQANTSNQVLLTLKEQYTKNDQKKNELFIQNALDQLVPLLDAIPENKQDFDQWQNSLKLFLSNMIQQTPFLTSEEKSFMANPELLDASESFIRKALEHDDTLDFESIGQALRNIWIALIFQMKYNVEPSVTESIFGYSMLYPLTDNLMDDPGMSANEKKAFCARLTQRLLHKSVEKQLHAEKDIFKMLDLIDSEYPPAAFPNVHESLLAIHKAQELSLIQQKIGTTPYTADLLGISFYKGGTSVIADAFLAKGDLTDSEQQFAYDFGALLQLCDDLQDVETDAKIGHMTIFSQLYKKNQLDPLVNKMLHFSDSLLKDEKKIGAIMHKNCQLLILGSSLMNPSMLSWRYRWMLKKYMPIRMEAFKKMSKKLSKKVSHLKLKETSLKQQMKIKSANETSTTL